jgi:hypothetical protein
MTIQNEIQPMIDENPYISGQATRDNILESSQYVLYVSMEGIGHIMDRHADPYAPGSLFTLPQEKFYTELEDIIVEFPTEVDARGMVRWLEVDIGSTIGKMGVAHADPSQVASMADYTMPGGRMEKVKVAAGERVDTSLLSVVAAKIGELQDGREVLSLVTMFPGSNSINGVEMPHDRSAFASAGFYFVLPPDSPALS